jgi:hypothetical protein
VLCPVAPPSTINSSHDCGHAGGSSICCTGAHPLPHPYRLDAMRLRLVLSRSENGGYQDVITPSHVLSLSLHFGCTVIVFMQILMHVISTPCRWLRISCTGRGRIC